MDRGKANLTMQGRIRHSAADEHQPAQAVGKLRILLFNLTLKRIWQLIHTTIEGIDHYEKYGNADIPMYEAGESDFDMEDSNTDFFLCRQENKD